jgi:uncharacterized Zn finger protein
MAARRRSRGGFDRRDRWEPWDGPAFPYRPPIPVPDGLRAKSRRGEIGSSWWSRRFIEVLERFHQPSRLQRGRAYARAGQVVTLDLGPGEVRAQVQGSRPEPYRVSIAVPVLGDADWERAEDAIVGRAVFLARLLSGEMPDEVEEAFADCSLSLFPRSRGDLVGDCSCPDVANPCKHIAAVYYLLAERFDEDPFLILAWRGRSRDRLLADLRARRRAAGTVPPEPEAEATPPSEPLPADPALFWGSGELPPPPEPAATSQAPDALLGQLPPSGLSIGGTPLEAILAPVYPRVAAALASEREEVPGWPSPAAPASVVQDPGRTSTPSAATSGSRVRGRRTA